MSDVRDMALTINKKDLLDAARMLGGVFQTFTASAYAGLLAVQAHGIEEEQANEVLLEFVSDGALTEVGPGVYSIKWESEPCSKV
jgi:hypothetical protein